MEDLAMSRIGVAPLGLPPFIVPHDHAFVLIDAMNILDELKGLMLLWTTIFNQFNSN